MTGGFQDHLEMLARAPRAIRGSKARTVTRFSDWTFIQPRHNALRASRLSGRSTCCLRPHFQIDGWLQHWCVRLMMSSPDKSDDE